ncbi:MAG: T9SS type A sorting domain-containing protein [Flavobacteriales bacterium]|nr:T9SS type A sorting domain-containing protein [Flavobacteriales bacterium]
MVLRYAYLAFTALGVVGAPVATLYAQGDTCTTALPVTSGLHHADGPSTGDPGPVCGGGGQNGDWYAYTASFTGTINLTSCNALNNNTDDDTYVRVYTGSCGSLTCVGYNDDMGQNSCPGYVFATYLDVAVTAGQTYYIVWTDMFDSDDFHWSLSECFGTVMGDTYDDNNNNGSRDTLENHVNVVLELNPGGTYVYAGSDPYAFCSDSGSYTISVPNPPLYHTAVPATRSYTVSTLGTLVTGMDFAFQSVPGIYDGTASIWGWNPWIGNNTHYQVNYANVGTEPLDGSVIVTLDPLTTFVSSAPAPDLVNGQVLTWNVFAMLPGESEHIDITYWTDSTAQTTDTVTASVIFDTNHTDQTPANNEDAITGHPTTSFDPNEKLVDRISLSLADVLNGTPLEYTIHFQNTGTQPAVNIILRDMIDADLDLSTFEMVGATHPNSVQFIGNEVVWTFAQIMLPDSGTDLEASQGGVHFRITPKNSSTPGTLFENAAGIYFDYNLPVITNTVVTEVTVAESVAELAKASGLLVYPSPGEGHMRLFWSAATVQNATLQVQDMTGRTLLDRPGQVLREGNSIALDLSDLSDGSYLVRVITPQMVRTTTAIVRH